jgi:hypothetical protein
MKVLNVFFVQVICILLTLMNVNGKKNGTNVLILFEWKDNVDLTSMSSHKLITASISNLRDMMYDYNVTVKFGLEDFTEGHTFTTERAKNFTTALSARFDSNETFNLVYTDNAFKKVSDTLSIYFKDVLMMVYDSPRVIGKQEEEDTTTTSSSDSDSAASTSSMAGNENDIMDEEAGEEEMDHIVLFKWTNETTDEKMTELCDTVYGLTTIDVVVDITCGHHFMPALEGANPTKGYQTAIVVRLINSESLEIIVKVMSI